MGRIFFSRVFMPHAITLLAAFIWSDLCAVDALGPMAGTGGPIRDAERRVLGGIPTKEHQEKPEIISEEKVKEKSSVWEENVFGEIVSVKVFGSAEFADNAGIADRILAELKGQGKKNSSDARKAIAKVRQALMKEGYYLSRISLARGKAYDAGTKTLYVLVDQGSFGKVKIEFEGEKDGTWFSSNQIERRFKDIEEGEVFDYTKLRSALFDANAHPDLTIDTQISVRKPIEGNGNDKRIARYADLSLDVHESFPFHAVWEVNNYGMEEINRWQTSLTAQYLNLTKHDDVLTISPSMSFGAELMSIAGSYMIPHYWLLGGNTTIYGGYTTLDVDDLVPKLDLEGIGWFAGLQHSEYLYDSERHLVALSAGVLWRYLEDQYTALGMKLNQRNASILPLSLALSYTGRKADFLGGRNFATMQGVFNFVNTGDRLDKIWTGAENKYWIFRFQAARLQPLFGWYDSKSDLDLHQWMLFLKLEGQYTSDSLIPLEKLSLGGYNCMRGYRTRGYLGDYGVYGTVELRSPILVDSFASIFSDRTNKTAFDRLQFLGFVDYGWLAYNDLPSGDDSEFIYSAGLGVRFAVSKYTQFKCDIAFPLRDTDWAKDDSFEFYVSAQIQF